MRSAYHRISMLIDAKQSPAEYMSGGGTHLTDYDPESGEYGDARYERKRGEAPPEGMVDSWVALHNSGSRTLDIAKRFKYPFHTVENEISKHPQGRGSVLTSVHLTKELAERVEGARGGEAASKFILKLLETAVGEPGYAKAAAGPAKTDSTRWLRMRERGLSNSQIAEAVGRNPRDITKAIGSQGRPGGPPKKRPLKVNVRMPLWLKNMLEATAEAVGTTRAKLQRALIGKGLELAGA